MLISSKKVLCLAISALTAFSVCLTGCGKDTQSSVSATEKTTAVVASQPVTKAATSDEQTQEPTWNYSELKRKSSDISSTSCITATAVNCFVSEAILKHVSVEFFVCLSLLRRESFHLMIQSTNIFRHINTAKKSPLKTCLQ